LTAARDLARGSNPELSTMHTFVGIPALPSRARPSRALPSPTRTRALLRAIDNARGLRAFEARRLEPLDASLGRGGDDFSEAGSLEYGFAHDGRSNGSNGASAFDPSASASPPPPPFSRERPFSPLELMRMRIEALESHVDALEMSIEHGAARAGRASFAELRDHEERVMRDHEEEMAEERALSAVLELVSFAWREWRTDRRRSSRGPR
jgi:hypothetical protein